MRTKTYVQTSISHSRKNLVDSYSCLAAPFSPDLAFFGAIKDRYTSPGYDSALASPHVHDCFEVGYCHRGRGHIKAGEKMFPFRAGDMIFINHTEPHIAYFATICVMSWLYFDPVRLLVADPSAVPLLETGTFAGPDFVNVFSGKKHAGLSAIVRNLIVEYAEKRPFYQTAIRSQVWYLMVGLHRFCQSGEHASGKTTNAGLQKLRPAVEYLHDHYAEKVYIRLLAETVAMSPVNFRRVFRQVIGKSPHEYLNDYRIAMGARALEESDRNVEEIAEACGFMNISTFRRAFKIATGCSPAAWRNRGKCRLLSID